MSRLEPVSIGSVVFALIDPTPGHELEFNHWYERDHYYTAGLAAPGVFSAGRYIAPRWCKALRRPTDDGRADDRGAGSHLALYFVMDGHDSDRVVWATEQVAAAAEEDRLFTEREHRHTWSYSVAWSWVDPDAGVPPALVLDRRYGGATVAFVDLAEGVGAGDLQAAEADSGELVDSVGVVLALLPSYEVMPSTWLGEIDPETRITLVYFHDGDVAAGWEASRGRIARLERDGLCSVVWASPFVVNVFGTDLHADEL
jgi:hypothetical protein